MTRNPGNLEHRPLEEAVALERLLDISEINPIAPVLRLLMNESVEDGVIHPAEGMISSVFDGQSEDVAAFFEHAIFTDPGGSVGADLLRVLGRNEAPLSEDWRAALIAKALRSGSLAIRDAAVQSAELWGDPSLKAVLANHAEQVNWLREYIEKVIHQWCPS